MARCWTCKRRRLKCDGGIPYCLKCWGHGVECLGYKKPLTWVNGVARRGPSKNRTFSDLGNQRPSVQETLSRADEEQRNLMLPVITATAFNVNGTWDEAGALALSPISGSLPRSLTEPLLEDLNNTSRFFIDYCKLFSHSSLI